MGYNLSRRTVAQHDWFLDLCKDAVDQQREIRIAFERDEIGNMRHRFRAALASARLFPDINQGDWAGLADAITLSVDLDTSEIIIKPLVQASDVRRFGLLDVAGSVKDYPGSLHTVKWWPAVEDTPDAIKQAFALVGWEVATLKARGNGQMEAMIEKFSLPPAPKPQGKASSGQRAPSVFDALRPQDPAQRASDIARLDAMFDDLAVEEEASDEPLD